MQRDEVEARLASTIRQLKKAEANASFGGAGTGVRVSDAPYLIETLEMTSAALKTLADENGRLTRLVYCPGTLRCAKCDFRLIKTVLTPSGAFANEEPDRCPNCDVPMWRVTWKDEAKDAYRTAESQMDHAKVTEARAIAAEEALKRAREMLSPLVDRDDSIGDDVRAALTQKEGG